MMKMQPEWRVLTSIGSMILHLGDYGVGLFTEGDVSFPENDAMPSLIHYGKDNPNVRVMICRMKIKDTEHAPEEVLWAGQVSLEDYVLCLPAFLVSLEDGLQFLLKEVGPGEDLKKVNEYVKTL